MQFDSLEYLKSGNDKQRNVYALLKKHAVFEQLHEFNPILVGTIPINIDIDDSDLDIICCYTSSSVFKSCLIKSFKDKDGFLIREVNINGISNIIANFTIDRFIIEVFGQNVPVKEQNGYKHMLVEHKILLEKGEGFRRQIIELKRKGMKTEPAFASLLELSGDPYEELLKLLN